MPDSAGKRLNKFISESGYCSRREADRFIEQGAVKINGKPAELGVQVMPGDVVMVNGHTIKPTNKESFVFIALNKPVGIVSTTDSAEPKNMVKFVGHKTRIFPIGRLDKDSQGLIFLTSNGDLVNKILRAGNQHEKEYVVTVDRPITKDFIDGMRGGVPILGTKTKKCKIRQESQFVFRMILTEGMNRQIRRMCEYFGYDVRKLERVRIMNVSLGKLQVGQWRNLTESELAELMKSIEHSSSEAPEGHRRRKPVQRATTQQGRQRQDSPRAKSRHPRRGDDSQVGRRKLRLNRTTEKKPTK
ncbi:23S rRNA pseudouridine(2604) synthase [Pseudidiomarina piscicola]|uniref:Pseudouridine synthase n=1 Tax=Pseudidiomarina piscicola TaxID=2614830 RepID=A0A6S6WPW7_9GAMM|nr:23S rRNA pseudouridine(2604) synthase RluF [Pseudidiomarina piscicola]CAB0149713.1 23S rRNA pseudouridine(2604) synthase [Pseudidiomarina piscicola]VZT39161.1 23S rRNA pseudouridine(2604) synthase [Pseudomonas aeruginosa]